jgi:ATP-dependent RNA helicase DDX52/ROK1
LALTKMDILKLLSRSTKQTQKSSFAKGGASTPLPSAGSAANPQLFHDAVPGAANQGKKRKRGGERVDELSESVAPEEIDFFASATPARKAAKNKPTSKDELADDRSAKQALDSPAPLALLDENECRQTLRSHRLKVTMLPPAQSATKTKKSKKDKKSKKELKPAKEEYKQLYPQPLMGFDELKTTYKISSRLAENIAAQGFKLPTEVQMGSLPLLLDPSVALGASEEEGLASGVDLLAVAPTGSGKTLAFLIPVINAIIQRRRTNKKHGLQAIVVAPTKELASQIVNEGKKLTVGTGIKVVGMRKGMRVSDEGEANVLEEKEDNDSDDEDDSADDTTIQSKQPLVKAEILVTTPLVLLNALTNSGQKLLLPTVQHLVLDEADVLLDPLFRDQTLGIWEACTNENLRALLYSATMGSNIEALAFSTINARKERLGIDDPSRTIRLVVGLKDSAIPNISHKMIYAATEPGKLIALRQLLHPTAKTVDGTASLRPPFLVFTQTIPRAVALHSELRYDIPAEAGGSSRIAVLHSDLSDVARDQVMTRFRNGEIWVLITTDILSRGVDFRGINGVVNYDVPNSGASYIHRVGRTGRAGRDGGIAVTYYTKEDIPYVKVIANIIAASEKQAGKTPEDGGMQKWLLAALPKVSKKEKKNLKMHGVEARRSGPGMDAKSQAKMKISTKSGFERRQENKKRGAIQGSKRRKEAEGDEVEKTAVSDGEFGGFDD